MFARTNQGQLLYGGQLYDPVQESWTDLPVPTPTTQPLSPLEALRWRQHESGVPIRAPLAVIGPNEASPRALAVAEAIGALVAEAGFVLLCGGRGGVMEAACKGAMRAGGITIGLLPGEDASEANPYVTIPLATGIGEARNALIARAGACLIAIGDSWGTLSEVALGLRFGRPVFGFAGAPALPGVVRLRTTRQLPRALAEALLLPPMASRLSADPP